MIPAELKAELDKMMGFPAETEWMEFKEAKNGYDFEEIGKYFSALSNEANLRGKPAGWLIFGVTDKSPRKICGTNYRHQKPGLDRLKAEIAQHTNHQITFKEIHELIDSQGRVVLFEIPPAPRGIPVTWRGKAYGRIEGSLSTLNLQEIEEIRGQGPPEDWSAQTCEDATIDDLDSQAIIFAKQEFKKKNPKLAEEVDLWDDTTFLNKSKICIRGAITRTAIILLGKNESEHFLSPAFWAATDSGCRSSIRQNKESDISISAQRNPISHRDNTVRVLGNS